MAQVGTISDSLLEENPVCTGLDLTDPFSELVESDYPVWGITGPWVLKNSVFSQGVA
jgi:hypothetical protein